MENVNKAAWITLDSAIKGYLIRKGESNSALYNKNLSLAIDCINELGYDVFKHFKEEILCVDQSTLTAKLPDDFVEYTKVGLINNNSEFIPLTYNDLMVSTDVPTQECHCDCGCSSPICESITSEVDTPVSLITQVKQCSYIVNFNVVSFPYTILTANTSDGVKQIQQTFTDFTGLDALFISLGWTVNSGTGMYEIDNSATVWAQFNLSGSQTIYVNEASCVVNSVTNTYTNTVKVKVNQDKSITKQTCLWGIASIPTLINSYITIGGSNLSFPFTNVHYIKNGLTTNVSNIATQNDLINFFTGLGFSILIDTDINVKFRTTSTDTWQFFGYTDSGTHARLIGFLNQAPQNQIAEQKCHTETICFVEEVKPCGCVTVSDATVNVLTQLNILNNQAYQRWLNGGSLYQTLAIAGNVWGYFKIDKAKGIVMFDKYWYQKGIYIQYYSANQVDSGDYLIPVQAKDAVMAYLNYASKMWKDNVSMPEKELAAKMWNTEKNNLKQYLNPFTEQDLLDIWRQTPSRP